jgi:hypothetical protein
MAFGREEDWMFCVFSYKQRLNSNTQNATWGQVLPQFQSISRQTAFLRTSDNKLEKQSTQARVNIGTVIHALIFFSSFHDDIIRMKKAWTIPKAS